MSLSPRRLRLSNLAFTAGEVAYERRNVYAAFLQMVLIGSETGKNG